MDEAQPGDVSRMRKAGLSSVLAALAIPGAVFMFFVVTGALVDGNVLHDIPLPFAIVVVLAGLCVPFLLGGGLWGYGMARLFGAPRWPAIRTAALSVMGMVVLLEAPVHLSQALTVPSWMPMGVHGAFTIVFMAEIGLVSGVASTKLVKRLDRGVNARRIGRRVGMAGTGGFLIGSLIALELGFEAGTQPGMNMVWALHVANLVAASTAGWALGWGLTASASRPGREASREAMAISLGGRQTGVTRELPNQPIARPPGGRAVRPR